MRTLTLVIDCKEIGGNYLMAVELNQDKPKGLPTMETTLENGLARRFDMAIRELIEIAKQGGLNE